METVQIIFDGVELVVPVINGVPLHMPHNGFDDFDTYCGAGKGIGDWLVPDTLFGVVISPACFVHDRMWEYAEATWADFHHSNSVFLHNILSIVDTLGGEDDHKHARYYRAVTYYSAVDTGLGKTIFWRNKT